MLQWLDDFLTHGATEKDLLGDFESFLIVCEEIGLKYMPKKHPHS